MTDAENGSKILLKLVERARDALTDFDADLERVDVEFSSELVKLFFKFEIPQNSVDRWGNSVTFDRPLNFTIEEIRNNQNPAKSYEKPSHDNETIEIAVGDLEPGEYTVILSSNVRQSNLERMVARKQFDTRVTRRSYDHNLIYKKDLTVTSGGVPTVITAFKDEIIYDNRYIPRVYRNGLENGIETAHSTAWSTPHNPESEIVDTTIDTDQLPQGIQQLLELPVEKRRRWFGPRVMGDFVTIEGGVKYHGIDIDDDPEPIPQEFIVESQTNFEKDEILVEGTVRFKKQEYWEEIKENLLTTN